MSASEEEQAKLKASLTEIDKGVAEAFVNSNELGDFENELTDITKEETLEKLAKLFEQLAA